jgi:CRISPR/Cas system CMR-associated protein Cmr5 small subunit
MDFGKPYILSKWEINANNSLSGDKYPSAKGHNHFSLSITKLTKNSDRTRSESNTAAIVSLLSAQVTLYLDKYISVPPNVEVHYLTYPQIDQPN